MGPGSGHREADSGSCLVMESIAGEGRLFETTAVGSGARS